jgi:hypothetical protein
MKRRNFFQTLAASAAALVLPKSREVEAKPEVSHPPQSTNDSEYALPHLINTMKTDKKIKYNTFVCLDNMGMVRPIRDKSDIIIGVARGCKKNPGGDDYLVDVVIRGY